MYFVRAKDILQAVMQLGKSFAVEMRAFALQSEHTFGAKGAMCVAVKRFGEQTFGRTFWVATIYNDEVETFGSNIF